MKKCVVFAMAILALMFSFGLASAEEDPTAQPGPGVSCTPVPGETVTVSDDVGNTYTVGKCSFPGGDPNRAVEVQAR